MTSRTENKWINPVLRAEPPFTEALLLLLFHAEYSIVEAAFTKLSESPIPQRYYRVLLQAWACCTNVRDELDLEYMDLIPMKDESLIPHCVAALRDDSYVQLELKELFSQELYAAIDILTLDNDIDQAPFHTYEFLYFLKEFPNRDEIFETCIFCLNSGTPESAKPLNAALYLGSCNYRREDALNSLLAAVKTSCKDKRWAIARALGEFADKAELVTPVLKEILTDADEKICKEAQASLNKIQSLLA